MLDGLPAFVLSASGLVPAMYRPGPLQRRAAACLRALKVDSEVTARRRLDQRPDLCRSALDALLIGVSGFFRDPGVFDALASTILPALASRPGPIRVCSIGCSTGEELYSVALLLQEAGLLARAALHGVDCRESAVAAARAGVYAGEALAGVPHRLRDRFAPCGGSYRLEASIRHHVSWEVSDVTRDVPHGAWDLILCRNLVIYLSAASADLLFTQLVERLASDGVLVVGKAERPASYLPLKALAPHIYARTVR